MFDHLSIGVTDYEKSKTFFVNALAPLGITALREVPYGLGLGKKGKPSFWLCPGLAQPAPVHIAFAAETRAEVDAFYRAALAAGGRDNGAPGLRPQYHPTYYGAFVIGPDGHNVEAVCHKPQG